MLLSAKIKLMTQRTMGLPIHKNSFFFFFFWDYKCQSFINQADTVLRQTVNKLSKLCSLANCKKYLHLTILTLSPPRIDSDKHFDPVIGKMYVLGQ